MRTPQAVQSIIEAAKQVEAETDEEIVLIVIDTISRALAGGDENSPKDMGAIVAATSRLQETQAHILWVHHMPQDGAERLRGMAHYSARWTPQSTLKDYLTMCAAPR